MKQFLYYKASHFIISRRTEDLSKHSDQFSRQLSVMGWYCNEVESCWCKVYTYMQYDMHSKM